MSKWYVATEGGEVLYGPFRTKAQADLHSGFCTEQTTIKDAAGLYRIVNAECKTLLLGRGDVLTRDGFDLSQAEAI